MDERRLILASLSPRRADLLALLTRSFQVVGADVDEASVAAGLDPIDAVRAVAVAKHDAARSRVDVPAVRILAADTLVIGPAGACGKPQDPGDARRMLVELSGSSIQIVSGVCVDGRVMHAVTSVDLRELSRPDIDSYVAIGAGADKAGALDLQGRAQPFMIGYRGCWNNVVGLPLCLTAALLGFGREPVLCLGLDGAPCPEWTRVWQSDAVTELPGPLVDSEWLGEHRDDVHIVDVRWYLDGRSGREAYERGHLPGAVFADLDSDLSSAPTRSGGRHPLPSGRAFAEAMGRLGVGDDTTVVAYDDAGGWIAARLWWMLDSLGSRCAVLDGGIDAWPGPLEVGTSDVKPATFSARPWPAGRFADADEVDGLRADPRSLLLDARSIERYRGDENPIDPRFGHIPGASSAPVGENLREGRFKAAGELAERYIALGADQAESVVVYCGSGVSACGDLLAMRLAGLSDGRLYVGSWSAWGADPDRPVATGEA